MGRVEWLSVVSLDGGGGSGGGGRGCGEDAEETFQSPGKTT